MELILRILILTVHVDASAIRNRTEETFVEGCIKPPCVTANLIMRRENVELTLLSASTVRTRGKWRHDEVQMKICSGARSTGF